MIAGTVTGNVGKDATTREHDGKTVLSFTVASRRFEKGAEQTDWVDVSHQGAKRSALTMRADDVELMGGKHDASGTSAAHLSDDAAPF